MGEQLLARVEERGEAIGPLPGVVSDGIFRVVLHKRDGRLITKLQRSQVSPGPGRTATWARLQGRLLPIQRSVEIFRSPSTDPELIG